MSNMEIFERTVIGKDGEEKKISEIIDLVKHTWTTHDGNIIMKHEGVLYLRKFTGATFLKPELQVQISNPGNVVYLCGVQFPNGEISYEIGESNNENTKGWSKGIKPTMATKRGWDRAFLRSDTIGLFEVYSEEESDDFKRQNNVIQLDADTYPNNNTNLPSQVQMTTEKKEYIFPPRETLFLPGTDPKYPGLNILDDICKIHRDFDYLHEILNNYPNNGDYCKAATLMLDYLSSKANSEKPNNQTYDASMDEKNPDSENIFIESQTDNNSESSPESSSESIVNDLINGTQQLDETKTSKNRRKKKQKDDVDENQISLFEYEQKEDVKVEDKTEDTLTKEDELSEQEALTDAESFLNSIE